MKPFIALAIVSLVASCSKESTKSELSYDLTSSILIPLKNQTPNFNHDASKFGMYHGVVASGTSQSRGKIWVNIGNDARYTATIELVGGNTISFVTAAQLNEISLSTTLYQFVGENASFKFDVTNYNTPIVSELEINNEAHFANVAKSRSTSMASSVTATFTEIGNPEYNGTWNMVSDGTVVNVNGLNGEGITSLMITVNGEVFTDAVFDSFDASTCFGISNFIPILNTQGIPNFIVSSYQTTAFDNGMAKWGLGFDPSTNNYMDYRTCTSATTGYFNWTDGTGNTRNGEIRID